VVNATVFLASPLSAHTSGNIVEVRAVGCICVVSGNSSSCSVFTRVHFAGQVDGGMEGRVLNRLEDLQRDGQSS
jgi:hypothetical protein